MPITTRAQQKDSEKERIKQMPVPIDSLYDRRDMLKQVNSTLAKRLDDLNKRLNAGWDRDLPKLEMRLGRARNRASAAEDEFTSNFNPLRFFELKKDYDASAKELRDLNSEIHSTLETLTALENQRHDIGMEIGRNNDQIAILSKQIESSYKSAVPKKR